MKAKFTQMFIYRNLPNIVSILGILPLAILFFDGGFYFLVPLIIYDNIMDDLDGILARKLNLKSDFGAILDDVCDGFAHIFIVMAVGMHYDRLVGAFCVAAVIAILLRVVSRIHRSDGTNSGTPTNELMRHILFVLLLAKSFEFEAGPYLIAVFVLNAVSMHVPYRMSYSIRSLTKSATAIGLVNVSLVVAWLAPVTIPVIAFCFFATYLYSLIGGGVRWMKRAGAK